MDWEKRYQGIAEELNLSQEDDLKAAEILDGMIQEESLDKLNSAITGKYAVVLGAGPSLEMDVGVIKKARLHSNSGYVLIVADGAVHALLNQGILPKIQVTDLDGDWRSIKKANRRGCITVVHAHGDNIDKLKRYVPELKDVIGTTQTQETGRLRNFGGFTDGDRAASLAIEFHSTLVVLVGMDFGSKVGKFSGEYNAERKIKKLQIGKSLLEEMVRDSRIPCLNLTHGGEDIKGAPRISIQDLLSLYP